MNIQAFVMKSTILLLFASAATLAAGELSPNQIPASAKWLLHADLDAMRASETGKAVFHAIEADHGAKLRAFKRLSSLHLLHDIRDVTLYGDGRKDRAVVLFDGNFDRAHIEDVVKAADDYSESTHAGFTIHSWKDKKKAQHAAFAAPDLLVFSPQDDLLKQALDTLKANAPAAPNPILPAAGSRPLVAIGARLTDIEMPEDSARVLRHIGLMKLDAREDGGRFAIRMNAETTDAIRANRLRRVLDGIIALAEVGNADLSSSGFQCDLAITDKPGVDMGVSLPVNEWLALLKKKADKHREKP